MKTNYERNEKNQIKIDNIIFKMDTALYLLLYTSIVSLLGTKYLITNYTATFKRCYYFVNLIMEDYPDSISTFFHLHKDVLN